MIAIILTADIRFEGVDLIINSTGGDVVYDKWHKYNRARAIENNCHFFATMGGDGTRNCPHAYAYGFNPQGTELEAINLASYGED